MAKTDTDKKNDHPAQAPDHNPSIVMPIITYVPPQEDTVPSEHDVVKPGRPTK